MKSKVFIQGLSVTCHGMDWRMMLKSVIQVETFDPSSGLFSPSVIQDIKENKCDVHLYVIIDEENLNAVELAWIFVDVMRSLSNPNKKTILHVVPDNFPLDILEGLENFVHLVKSKGGIAYVDSELNRTARVINNAFKTTDFD